MLTNLERTEKSRSSALQIISRFWLNFLGSVFLGSGSVLCLYSAFSITVKWDNLLGQSLSGGMLATWNQIAETLGREQYILLDVYETESDNGLFTIFSLIMLIGIAFLALHSNALLIAALYLLPVAILSVFYTLYPDYLAVILMVIGIAVGSFPVDGERYSVVTGIFGASIYILIGLLIFGICSVPEVSTEFTQPAVTLKAHKAILKAWDKFLYTDVPELSVTMERPQSMYLKGFVGEQYGQDGWSAISNAKQYEEIKRDYWLDRKGFRAMGQLTQADEIAGEDENLQKIEINVGGKSSKYVYFPYELAEDSVAGAKKWGNAFLTVPYGSKGKKYSYSVSESKTSIWTDLAGKLFTTPANDTITEYERLESYYNHDVYEKYLDISDSEIDLLAEEFGTRGNQEKGHIDYKTAIQNIKNYMDDNLIYSTSGRSVDKGKEFETILTTHKGDDAAYATATAIMFRYYGIPSRYIEGYLVTLDDEKKIRPRVPFNIDRTHRHAWAEIYIDALGWVPIETCSEYYGIMKDADLSKGIQNSSSTVPFDQPEKHRSAVSEEEKTSDPQEADFPWDKLFRIALNILLFLLILVILLFGFMKVIAVIKRHRAFMQKDVRRGICEIYEYMKDNNIPVGIAAKEIAMRSAYSTHEVVEEDRLRLLDIMRDGKQNARKRNGNEIF